MTICMYVCMYVCAHIRSQVAAANSFQGVIWLIVSDDVLAGRRKRLLSHIHTVIHTLHTYIHTYNYMEMNISYDYTVLF